MVKAAPWWLLLWPRWRTVLNGPVAASSRRRLAGVLFGLLGLAFWAAIFFSAWWFFHRCLGVELVGPLLVRKVLDMAFLVFLSVLLFSNLIAAFSTFFLADDLTMLAALPVHVDRLYLSRLGETSLHSSWTILIFGLPILAAAGLVFDAGAGYYVLAALVLPPFLILPAVLGSAVTLLLVLVFPARRARDLLLLLGLVAFCVLFVLFRLLQPERLLDDGQFGDLVSFLATFQTPQAEWLPSAWLVRAIFPALRGQPPWDGEAAGLADLGMLFLSAAAVLVLGTWLNRPLYRKAYSRSLEGNGRPIGCGGLVLHSPDAVASVSGSGSPLLEMLRKDLLVFLRDPSQWSQILLLVALVVVYVFNFKNFRVLGESGIIGEQGLYHLNLGLSGFVLAAVGTRLIFPAISLEGKAFWLLRSAPLPLREVLRAKLLAGLLPSLLLGSVTIGLTSWLLGSPALLVAISLITVWALALLVAGMGTGLGALFPSFEAENASRIAAGFGGIVYMVLTMSAILLVLLLAAWPVYLLHRTFVLQQQGGFPLRYWLIAGLCGLLAAGVLGLATWLPLRLGEKSLGEKE